MTEGKTENYPEDKGSGSSTSHGYSVEARLVSRPAMIAGQIIDSCWRTVSFDKGPVGVPPPCFSDEIQKSGLLGYAQAQAMRWWFHAVADTSHDGTCLETKLVKHEVRASHTVQAVSEHMRIGGDDRSNCIPDWGVKKDSD